MLSARQEKKGDQLECESNPIQHGKTNKPISGVQLKTKLMYK